MRNLNPEILLIYHLAKTIFYAKKNYYSGKPTLVDEDYDRLEYSLQRLCPKHPVLECVGDPSWDLILSAGQIEGLIKERY